MHNSAHWLLHKLYWHISYMHRKNSSLPIINNACNTNMLLNSHINCPWKRTCSELLMYHYLRHCNDLFPKQHFLNSTNNGEITFKRFINKTFLKFCECQNGIWTCKLNLILPVCMQRSLISKVFSYLLSCVTSS